MWVSTILCPYLSIKVNSLEVIFLKVFSTIIFSVQNRIIYFYFNFHLTSLKYGEYSFITQVLSDCHYGTWVENSPFQGRWCVGLWAYWLWS